MPGAWPHARAAGCPHAARPGPAIPADVAADVALYEGDVDAALRHYDAEVAVARRDDDPIRLVWTLYYVAICHAVRRDPELGLAGRRGVLRVAESTANPTARSMARYALGLVLKKSDPARALALFDEAAELAGVGAQLLVGGHRADGGRGDPRRARRPAPPRPRAFVDVLDHWDRVGDRTQQWLNLRYVVRLLVRLGADEDAVALHHCLLARGQAVAA